MQWTGGAKSGTPRGDDGQPLRTFLACQPHMQSELVRQHAGSLEQIESVTDSQICLVQGFGSHVYLTLGGILDDLHCV